MPKNIENSVLIGIHLWTHHKYKITSNMPDKNMANKKRSFDLKLRNLRQSATSYDWNNLTINASFMGGHQQLKKSKKLEKVPEIKM